MSGRKNAAPLPLTLRLRSTCPFCKLPYPHKDARSVTYRSVFGRVALPSPRWYQCSCTDFRRGGRLRRSTWSPLTDALRQRVSPHLERLQVEFAAHLPYARVVDLHNQVLPVDDCISVSGTKNRVRAVAEHLDDQLAEVIEGLPESMPPEKPTTPPTSASLLAVDSVWLRHCRPGRMHQRQVSIAAARATLADGSTRVCGYVTKQVTRSSKRMDGFLRQLGVQPHERVTVAVDAAGEFETAIAESRYAGLRIIDWFHIAMKFRAAELSTRVARERLTVDWKAIRMHLERAKWRLWHGRVESSIDAIKTLVQVVEMTEDEQAITLGRNLDKLLTYLESNRCYMLDYGERYRAGLPISRAPAESAVNQLVSVRMAKRHQMRWSDDGAHALVQVRAAVLNRDHESRPRPAPWYLQPARKRESRETWELLAA